MANRQIANLPKMEYTVYGSFVLYKTVSETGWCLEPELACIGSLWPDRQYILPDQAVYISRGCPILQESKAYFYR